MRLGWISRVYEAAAHIAERLPCFWGDVLKPDVLVNDVLITKIAMLDKLQNEIIPPVKEGR